MIAVLWVIRIFRRFVGRGLDPALQNEETGVQTLSVRGKAKPQGRPTGRPYDRTETGACFPGLPYDRGFVGHSDLPQVCRAGF